MIKRIVFFVLAVLVIMGLCSGAVRAAIPNKISFQGRLTDSAGKPITGIEEIKFDIYDDATAVKKPLMTETMVKIKVDSNGVFNVLLGTDAKAAEALSNLKFDNPYWVAITVNGVELSPRQPLVSVPYAFHAKKTGGIVSYSTPPSAGAGQIYFDSTVKRLRYSDGTQWIQVDPAYTENPMLSVRLTSLVSSDKNSTGNIFTPTKDCILVGCSGKLGSGDSPTGSLNTDWCRFKLTQGGKDKVYFTVFNEESGTNISEGRFYYAFSVPIKVNAGTAVLIETIDSSVSGLAYGKFNLYYFDLYYIELPL